MLDGKCLLCFTVNRQTVNILNTPLHQVLEKIVDSKIEVESLGLCFICHKRTQQCYQLMQLAKASQWNLNTMRNEKIDVNLKKHGPLLELTTSKVKNISFSEFESQFEIDVEVKKEYFNVGVDEMEQGENFHERLECGQSITDDPLKDTSREHDDLKQSPPWIKTEVEGVSIEFEGLGEIKTENDEQVTSVNEDTYPTVDYRPEFTNIVIEPDTKNVNENISNTLNNLKMCKFCPFVAKQKSNMVRHQRTHTGEKPFVCDVCNNSFSQKHAMIEHKRTHTGEKPYTCDICQRKFSQREKLKNHIITHSGEKPFSCDICERKFKSKRYLRDHRMNHRGKLFSCDLCDGKFSQRFYLTEHRRSHTGDKPYVCEICEKGFTRKSYLCGHRKTHSDWKPFKCDMCDRNFSDKYALKNHKIVHTGEKPFACDLCDKKFSKTCYLKEHKRTHTGVKPYKCETCERKFSQKGALNRHKKTHHSI